MIQIAQLLGDKADYLLNFKSPKISKDRLHVPGPDFVDRIVSVSDRNNRVLGNLHRLFGHGRLAGTGCEPGHQHGIAVRRSYRSRFLQRHALLLERELELSNPMLDRLGTNVINHQGYQGSRGGERQRRNEE